MISKLYKLILEAGLDDKIYYMKQWERDLGITFKDEEKKIILLSCKALVSSKFQENGYKILTRWYYTPDRIHLFGKSNRQMLEMREREGDIFAYVLDMYTCSNNLERN